MVNKRGQNVIEYILLIVAVLTVLILFLSPGAKFHKSIEKGFFNGTIKQVDNIGNGLNLP